MEKRKWHYLYPPKAFECKCEKCNGRNLTWSEWDNHLWCYDCQIDFDPKDSAYSGVFSGPIPIGVSSTLGLSFDRYMMQEDRIERFNINTLKWDKDWFFYKYETLFEHLILDKIDQLDNTYGDVNFITATSYFDSILVEYRRGLYAILEKYKTPRT